MIKTLDIDSIIEKTPSVGCSMPSLNLSDRYCFLSTQELLKGCLKLGWKFLDSEQKGKRVTTQHRVALTHDVVLNGLSNKDDGYPFFYIINSHDGSCGLKYVIAYHFIKDNTNIISNDSYMQDSDIKHNKSNIEDCVKLFDSKKSYISYFVNCINTMKNRNISSEELCCILSYLDKFINRKGFNLKIEKEDKLLHTLIKIQKNVFDKKILRGFDNKFLFSQRIWDIMCSCLIFKENDLVDYLNQNDAFCYEQ